MSKQEKCCATCGWLDPTDYVRRYGWCDKHSMQVGFEVRCNSYDPAPTPKFDRAGVAELYGLSPTTRAALQPPPSDDSPTEGVEI